MKRHNRSLPYVLVGILALCAELVVASSASGAVGLGSSMPLSARQFANEVTTHTKASGAASISFSSRETVVGGCIPASNVPIGVGNGVIDFATRSIEYTSSTHGCKDLHVPQGTSKWEQTPQAIYQTFPRGEGGLLTSKSKPWRRIPLNEYLAQGATPVTISGFLTSPSLLAFLSSLSSPLTKMGSEKVRGVATTEYSAFVSLSAMYKSAERADPTFFSVPTSSVAVVPAATAIHITAEFWIDAEGRLRQVRASEPLYTAIYQDGSDTENATQAPAVSQQTGKDLTIRTLRQQSFAQVTVNLSDFGPKRIRKPPASLISPLKH